MKRTPVPPSTKEYQLNICKVIKDQVKCPGFITLSAGGSVHFPGRLQLRLSQEAVAHTLTQSFSTRHTI
jgi:hypothetical protein